MSGQFSKTTFFQHTETYTSLLQMNRNHLFKSDLGRFSVFERNVQGINTKPQFTNASLSDSEITSMISKDDIIFGGKANGSVFTYNNDNYNEEFIFQNKEQINCVDFYENTFIATTNNSTKILNLTKELGMITFDVVKTLDKGFKIAKFNPNASKLVAYKEGEPGKYYFLDPIT